MKTSNIVCSKSLVSLFATGALVWGMALPLQAAESGYGARTQQVSLTDLDLETPAGQAAARERLHQTARQLCMQVEDLDDLSHHDNYLKCVEQASARTQPHLDALIRRASAVRTAANSEPGR